VDLVKRVNLLGCPFDAISFSEVVENIKKAVRENRRLQIVTANIDFVMKARRDPVFAKALWKADLVVADGVPIKWATSMLGEPLKGRVNGTDLVWKCAEISAQMDCGVALIGAEPGVAQRAAEKMKGRWPEAKIYTIPTPFPLRESDNEGLVKRVRDVMGKIVLVALGAPLQDRWVQSYLGKCGANVGIGIGSALDIICGDKPRAPKWMSENGFEWVHRMLLEPRRLSKRYIIEDSPFLIFLGLEVIRRKLRHFRSLMMA
jgi:N-acetylglucosaminyldiphosphoundecaprenol N-acetyl-beta-D-mannosaminyltransferase